MTKYTKKQFSVAVGSDDYRDNYDRVFGKDEKTQVSAYDQCLTALNMTEEGQQVEVSPKVLERLLKDYRKSQSGLEAANMVLVTSAAHTAQARKERDEARAEAARLKEVLSLAATCILKQCRCMEECGCVPASVLAALPKEEP